MTGNDCRGLPLPGLDGSNPLGFLSAVGTLRTLTLADPGADWRMKWVERKAIWIPKILVNKDITPDVIVDQLVCALRLDSMPEFNFDKNLTLSPERFSEVAREAQHHAARQFRRHADFIAAFGCEILTTKKGEIQDTGFRTMNGAGNQHFLGTMKQLAEETEACDLHRSLFEPWTYQDRKMGLRWDPQEDRRYALRWANPSDGDGVPTMRGANRLAIEALPLLPTAPVGKRLNTTGFARREHKDWLSWPIWTCAIGIDVVRSLLSLAETQKSTPDHTELRARGVAEIYRSCRKTVGKYRSFLPARPA